MFKFTIIGIISLRSSEPRSQNIIFQSVMSLVTREFSALNLEHNIDRSKDITSDYRNDFQTCLHVADLYVTLSYNAST